MKKFLIGIIFIIPIIVVIAISATGNIIAMTKQVNATSIVLRDEKNNLIDTNTPLAMDVNDDGIQIIAEVLPTITYNKEIVYEIIKDDSHTGEATLSRYKNTNRYKIAPVKNGNVRMVIRASNNREVYRALEIYVTTNKLEYINIYDDSGVTLASATARQEISINTPTKVFAYISPMDALAPGSIVWTSDNTEIVEVTDNGMVYPISRGRTSVRVSATDKLGTRLEQFLVINTQSLLVKSDNIYVNSAVDAEWISQNIALDRRYAVTSASGAEFYVSSGDITQKVVVNICEPNEWDFFDAPQTAYTNNGEYYLSARYLKFGARGVVSDIQFYLEGDTSVATVIGNKFLPRRAGEVTLVAKSGATEKRITIVVKERLTNFNLSLNKEDGELGIEMTRVWGQYFVDASGAITNNYKLNSSIVDGQADYRWSTSNTEYATISDEGLVTFYPQSAGNEVTVSITIYVNNYPTNAMRSFTFKMVDSPESINVGSDTQDPVADNKIATDLFFKLLSENKGYALVLQHDITVIGQINLTASLYGNGFMIDAKDYKHYGTFSQLVEVSDGNIVDKNSTIELRNFTIQGAENFEKSAESNRGIRITGMAQPVQLMYSCVRFFNVGVDIRNNKKEVLVQGCILGDCSFSGISFEHTPPAESYIVVRDCVAKATTGPTIFAAQNEFTKELLNKNIMPHLKIEGFFDCYNWKTPYELKHMLSALDKSLLSALAQYIDPQKVIDALGAVIGELFLRDDMAALRYVAKNDKGKDEIYVNIGLFALGAFNKPNGDNIVVEDEGLRAIEIKIPTDDSAIGFMVKLFDSLVKLYDNAMTIKNSCYIVTYDVLSEGGPRNKPNDPVPQNTELYKKLNGIASEVSGVKSPIVI